MIELYSDISIQQALHWLGYNKNYDAYGIDGILGDKGSPSLSREDIKYLQQDNGLEPDGIWGFDTQRVAQDLLWTVQATEHFHMSEFACETNVEGTIHDEGCNGWPEIMNITFLGLLEELRKKVDQAIVVTSGVRCQTFNDSLSGSAVDSYHRLGRAADIYCSGWSPTGIARLAESLGLKTIVYETFTHVQYNGEGY